MNHALQRRLARLFPEGNETLWLDCRAGVPWCAPPLSVAVIDLNFIAASGGRAQLPARSLVLDMDGGADMEDAIRSGADGMLCSTLLPWVRISSLARQCRRWNYPFIADCRETPPGTIRRFLSLGANAAVATAPLHALEVFQHCISRIIPTAAITSSLASFTGARHEH